MVLYTDRGLAIYDEITQAKVCSLSSSTLGQQSLAPTRLSADFSCCTAIHRPTTLSRPKRRSYRPTEMKS